MKVIKFLCKVIIGTIVVIATVIGTIWISSEIAERIEKIEKQREKE